MRRLMRKFDLLIMHTTDNERMSLVPVSNGKTAKIAGVQKAIQQFLNILLTRIGSKLNNADEGTRFMVRLQSDVIPTELALRRVFNIAVLETFRQYSRIEPSEYADERIKKVELTDLEFNIGEVYFTVNVLTDAGEYPEIILPVEIK